MPILLAVQKGLIKDIGVHATFIQQSPFKKSLYSFVSSAGAEENCSLMLLLLEGYF